MPTQPPTCLTRGLAAAAAILLAAPPIVAQQGSGTLDALARPHAGRIAHYSSRDTTEGNADFRVIAPGETITLVDHRGAGIVRRWWVTIAPRNNRQIQRQLIVRCWWDDETEPSIEVPISDFFGVGFGEWRQYTSLPLNMTSGGYDAYWAMPFRRHARITVENRSGEAVGAFYYNVDVETRSALDDSTLYFHAQFRRVITAAGQPVTVLDATGRGQESDSGRWSGRTQLWWTLAKPGARLTLPIRVGSAGSYDLTGYFARAGDYGNVRLRINGRTLPTIVRGYAPDVSPTGPISFGRVQLRAGVNDLAVEIVGKDPQAKGYSDGYLVGIDAFAVRRVLAR